MDKKQITDLRQEALERIHIDLDVMVVDHQHEANKLLAPYADGWMNAAEAFAKIQHLKKVIEIAEYMIKDDAVNYIAERYGKKECLVSGVKMSYKSGAAIAKYDNNPLIQQAAQRLKFLQDVAKSLAKSQQREVADTETGEIIYPATFEYNKDTLVIKF